MSVHLLQKQQLTWAWTSVVMWEKSHLHVLFYFGIICLWDTWWGGGGAWREGGGGKLLKALNSFLNTAIVISIAWYKHDTKCKMRILQFLALHTWLRCECEGIRLLSCTTCLFSIHRHSGLCLEPEPCQPLSTASGNQSKTPAWSLEVTACPAVAQWPARSSLFAPGRQHAPCIHWSHVLPSCHWHVFIYQLLCGQGISCSHQWEWHAGCEKHAALGVSQHKRDELLLQGWERQSSFLPQKTAQKFTGFLKSVRSPRNLASSQRSFPHPKHLYPNPDTCSIFLARHREGSVLQQKSLQASLHGHEKHWLTCTTTREKSNLQWKNVLGESWYISLCSWAALKRVFFSDWLVGWLVIFFTSSKKPEPGVSCDQPVQILFLLPPGCIIGSQTWTEEWSEPLFLADGGFLAITQVVSRRLLHSHLQHGLICQSMAGATAASLLPLILVHSPQPQLC